MILYTVKPKLQQIEQDLQISQSEYMSQQHGVTKFRIRPNQFQKEKVNLFNIPAQDQPYRIPGSKIAITTSTPINQGGFDEESTRQLRTAVQLAIDVLKRCSHNNDHTEDFKYDSLEINDEEMKYLSHKQQLQVLNELTTLRKEIYHIINHKDKWVEVITADVAQQSKISFLGGQSILNKDDLTFTKVTTNQSHLNTQDVNQHISQLQQQPDPGLFTGQRPPPEGDDWKSYTNRPYSPEQEAKVMGTGTNMQDQQRQKLMINYEEPKPKRYKSKYRPISEFKRGYQSEYQQSKLRPPTKIREPRDFIQENIDNQQYYRKGSKNSSFGVNQPVRTIHVDEAGRRYTNDQLTELMMRIHMQRLAYQAKAGKPDAYKQLVIAQQQMLDRLQGKDENENYDDVARDALDELYHSQAQIQEQEELIQQLRDTIRQQKSGILQSQVKDHVDQLYYKQSGVHESRVAKSQNKQVEFQPDAEKRARATETLINNVNRSQMYKVVLPQFSSEYKKQLRADHEEYITKLKQDYQNNYRVAPADSVLINKLNTNFIQQFSRVCDMIFAEILDNEIQKFVDATVHQVETNMQSQIEKSQVQLNDGNKSTVMTATNVSATAATFSEAE